MDPKYAGRSFHAQNGLYFIRQPDGSVCIVKTNGPHPNEGGTVILEETLSDATFVSGFLAMCQRNELDHSLPVLDHYHGRRDLVHEAVVQ